MKKVICVFTLLLCLPFLLGFTGIERNVEFQVDGEVEYFSKSDSVYGDSVVTMEGEGVGSLSTQTRMSDEEHYTATEVAGDGLEIVVGTKDKDGNVYVHGGSGKVYMTMEVRYSNGEFTEVVFDQVAEVDGLYRRNIDVGFTFNVDDIEYHANIFERMEVSGYYVGGDYIRFQPQLEIEQE